jgi:hypothetical protein
VEAVDQPVRLVQFASQRGPVLAVVRGAADGSASATPLGGFEFVRDLGDVLAQFSQQCPRLGRSRVFDHSWIVSPIPNVRATGSQKLHIVAQTSTWCREGAGRASAYALAAASLP